MLICIFAFIIVACLVGTVGDWTPTFEQKFLILAVLGIGAVLTLLKSL